MRQAKVISASLLLVLAAMSEVSSAAWFGPCGRRAQMAAMAAEAEAVKGEAPAAKEATEKALAAAKVERGQGPESVRAETRKV